MLLQDEAQGLGDDLEGFLRKEVTTDAAAVVMNTGSLLDLLHAMEKAPRQVGESGMISFLFFAAGFACHLSGQCLSKQAHIPSGLASV